MKVTQVALRSTPASDAAGRPALTPELLAASGARYSRSNDGLEAIIEKIDPNNLDRSVDSIFRMIDYGHQSIADMAPVAMFIDGISLWLAYQIWSLCPTAGGQESSTRYIQFGEDRLIPAAELGIPNELLSEWTSLTAGCFAAFQQSLEFWESLAKIDPSVARIPRSLLEDSSEKARRQVARMRRNYGFDRARYLLPAALGTNMMLVMSARAWVQLCRHLRSNPLIEAQAVGVAIASELELAAPRMVKHAVRTQGFVDGMRQEFERLANRAARTPAHYLAKGGRAEPQPAGAYLDVMCGDPRIEGRSAEDVAPHGRDRVLPTTASFVATVADSILPPAGDFGGDCACTGAEFAEDLAFHDNRYGWMGERLRRTAVRFGWAAAAFAEIRDLNRHRTGAKHCPLLPVGFYDACDQLPQSVDTDEVPIPRLCAEVGRDASGRARSLLAEGRPAYVYWTTLGTQFPFEHVTTADKFLYEAELRTGTGAHYRYAEHLHDTLALWYARYPETRGLVIEGSAEPE